MKKQTKLFLTTVVVVLIVGVAQYILRNQTNLESTDFQKKNLSITNEAIISPTETFQRQVINLDFGNGQKFSGQVNTQNAYQALARIAKDNNMTVEIKQYKYGIMVEKVGNIANNQNSAWMYAVNGKPGQIAADRYVINPGDKVDWKFTKF